MHLRNFHHHLELILIDENIAKIISICEKKYSAKKTYGEDALNRMILLDAEIANLLTPDVLQFLFTNEPTEKEQTTREDKIRNIRDIIDFGFIFGLLSIKLLPNNQPKYGLDGYNTNQENFEKNTCAIVRNIALAAGVDESKVEQPDETALFKAPLNRQYDLITRTIDSISQDVYKQNELIKVAGFSSNQMIQQVKNGFTNITNRIVVQLTANNKELTLDNYCELFLSDPEIILHADVGHAILDRAHMEVAILRNDKIVLGGKDYNYRDIFRKMIQKISDNPDKYPHAKEQFFLRLSILENDLQNRFKDEFINSNPTVRLAHEILKKANIEPPEGNAHLLNEALLRQIPVSEIYKAIESSAENPSVKNEFKKQLLNYQLDNLKEVTAWQWKLLPQSQLENDVPNLQHDDKSIKNVLTGIQYLIIDTKWDIGTFGGEKIVIDNTTITIPKGMNDILKEIDKAYKETETWSKALDNVEKVIDASLNRGHGILNVRSETTQIFYDRAKALVSALREEGRKEDKNLEQDVRHESRISLGK